MYIIKHDVVSRSISRVSISVVRFSGEIGVFKTWCIYMRELEVAIAMARRWLDCVPDKLENYHAAGLWIGLGMRENWVQ